MCAIIRMDFFIFSLYMYLFPFASNIITLYVKIKLTELELTVIKLNN